jgi:hypothetical protein
MLGAPWCGGAILSFFGVSIAALRVAGGLIVASFAWQLLHAPEKREVAKHGQAQEAEGLDAIAFFPLTLPFTDRARHHLRRGRDRGHSSGGRPAMSPSYWRPPPPQLRWL